jgi:hypothetical protein
MHQKYRIFVLALFALASLAGVCNFAFAVDAGNVARIRVFKESKVILNPGDYCYGSHNASAIEASDGAPSMLSWNRKVGMPLTEDTPANYNEYIIEAGKPLSLVLYLEGERDGVKVSCGPLGATFFPQPSRDYDLTMGFTGVCVVQLRELSEISPGMVITRVVPTSPSFACPNQ